MANLVLSSFKHFIVHLYRDVSNRRLIEGVAVKVVITILPLILSQITVIS